MWHRGWWFVAGWGPGRARPGRSGPVGTHLWSHKALDYVRVNPCTPLDSDGGGRGHRKLSKAPAVKLRPQRRAAQADSLFCFFLSHAVLRSSIATGRKCLGERVMEDGRQDFTRERTR